MENMQQNYAKFEEMLSAHNGTVEIYGKISGISNKDSSYQYELKNVRIHTDREEIGCKAVSVVCCENMGASPGDTVAVTGSYQMFANARNPGNFDEKNYYHTMGIAGRFMGETMVITGKARFPAAAALAGMRNTLNETLYRICNEKEAALFGAILLGEKGRLDPVTKSLYIGGGIAHILSISGLHLSIIGSGIFSLVRRRFLFATSGLISAAAVLAFGIMAGSPVSLMRALIMFSIKLLAEVTGRTYDLVLATAVAAFLILADNPFYIFHTGFQLSFLAVLGIGIPLPVIEAYFSTDRKILKAFQSSLGITVLTCPVILNIYFEIPLYSPIINLLVIPFMEVMLLSGIFASIAGSFVVAAGYILIGAGCFVLRFYEFICRFFFGLPFFTITVGKMTGRSIFLYYLVIAAAVLVMALVNKRNLDENYRKVRLMKRGFIWAVAALLAVLLAGRPENSLKITMVDVGQGEALLIQTPAGKNICVDGGSTDVGSAGKYRLIPYLKSLGISRIDYFIVTHLDEDHTSILTEIFSDYDGFGLKTECFIFPRVISGEEDCRKFVEKARLLGISTRFFDVGTTLSDDRVAIRCLHPATDFPTDDKNETSLVLELEYGNFQMLFTGDIGEDGEKALIDSGLLTDCDILKVAHHGSTESTTEEFLKEVSPEFALISCGVDNVYGHPHPLTMERLSNNGIKSFTTAEKGAIVIRSDGKNYEIDTYLE
ncbi:competence protein ComEC [Parasporobacterium paucivorans DSM 15970]|uniref:Competence protein ComEC n=2 Tax=Parasporobacterium TaxID=115543 RepID=A0A1M6G7G4_9FIRM|nr:competence protein ComEC [Parasporobacterium paucivorans DSM 15970]